MSRFDVAVLGGGPAGAAAAMQLADSGQRVLLVESSRYEQTRIGETLPPRARVPLARLGLTERMQGGGHVSSPATVSIWGAAEPKWNDFIANPYGSGWHIDRSRFDRMLAGECRARGVEVREGLKAGHCTHGASGWSVALYAGSRQPQEHITCRFVVDASGRAGRRIPHSGLPIVHDRLVGIAALYTDCAIRNGDDLTLIESVPHGWWYSARIPDARCIAVFMTDSDLVHGGRGGLRSFLQRQLDEAPWTRQRVGPIAEAQSTSAWPAMTATNTVVAGNDWLLVGDAAMAWDPLSGQGICKALESGIEAASTIGRALEGDAEAFEDYSRSVCAQFEQYLKTRADHYSAEQRWRDFAFWSRRHAPFGRPQPTHRDTTVIA